MRIIPRTWLPLDAAILHCSETFMLALIVTPKSFPFPVLLSRTELNINQITELLDLCLTTPYLYMMVHTTNRHMVWPWVHPSPL